MVYLIQDLSLFQLLIVCLYLIDYSLQVTVTSPVQQTGSSQEQADEVGSQESASDAVPRTPPPKSGAVASSAPTTPVGSHASPGTGLLKTS